MHTDILYSCLLHVTRNYHKVLTSLLNKRLRCSQGNTRQWHITLEVNKWIICSWTNAPFWSICPYKVPWPWNPG